MNKNKIFSVIIIIFTLICQIPTITADNNTVTISSADDFTAFAKNCTLDTWSQGKTVYLSRDIDMSGADFSPVPTFGGLFYGNGHTISGITFDRDGSNLGLFRYIQKNAKVTNLNVTGSFTPGGSKSFVGGIAGENAGTIELCNFNGKIKGENVTGGIAGINSESGRIVSCTFLGSIGGENFTGGITGKNEGFISDCTNGAEVNTVYEEKKRSIADIDTDAGSIVESYRNEKSENEEESILGHTDTGGIAGYTSGIVQGCTNNGAVGYQHVGYNVGGIAGRQSGYILGCKNFGFIQGRKDVGGIAGQMEPYILLSVSESTLRDLRGELNNLHSAVDRLIADTDYLGSDAESYLNGLSDHSKAARDSAEIMVNQGSDFIDNNLEEINAEAAIISNTLDKLAPVFDTLGRGASDAGAALDDAVAALDGIDLYAPDLGDELDAIDEALTTASGAERRLSRAADLAGRASKNLDDAVKHDSPLAVNNALSELSSAVKDMAEAKRTIRSSVEDIETILKTSPESFESIGINAGEILEDLKAIKENTDTVISSLKIMGEGIDKIAVHTDINFSSFKSAADNMKSSIEYLDDVVYFLTASLREMRSAIRNTSDKLEEYSGDISEQLNDAKEKLSNSLSSLSYATDDIKDALGDMEQIITDLSNEDSLEFVRPDDDFKNANDNLFNSLSDISGDIEAIKNAVSADKDKITGSLRAVSKEFNLVMNLIVDEFEQLKNTADLSDIFLDESDEDISNTKQGKVYDCENFGKISADRNTGGIAGSMAIEYSKDPEDDIEKPDTLNFTYRTKAILQSCINSGEAVGKKDCTGGIVGLVELGTVYDCQNYGNISSTSGNYVGGVAGKSESSVRKCYAKCNAEGKRFVGGISGAASNLSSCYSIVNITGGENMGAICGACDKMERVYKNFFVDNALGGIDGISYKGKAEPISFDLLKNINGIPKRFVSFKINFIADDRIIETQELKYGDDTAKIKFPEIPAKEGQFGNWQSVEEDTVTRDIDITCEYKPYITVLASAEKNASGKLPLALAEGEFTDKAELHACESIKAPYKNAYGDVKVYDIALSGTNIKGDDAVTIRILNQNRDKAAVWCYAGGAWEPLQIKERGKYVILQTTGAENTICVQYIKRSFSVLLPAVITVIIAVIAVVLYKIIKKKH